MHGDGTVNLMVGQHLVHLLVTLILVGNMDGGHAGSLQSADVVDIDATVSSHLCSSNGVYFTMLAAHTGQSDLGTAAEGTGLQTLCHLQEGIGNEFFQIHNGSTSLILLQPAGLQQTRALPWRSSS